MIDGRDAGIDAGNREIARRVGVGDIDRYAGETGDVVVRNELGGGDGAAEVENIVGRAGDLVLRPVGRGAPIGVGAGAGPIEGGGDGTIFEQIKLDGRKPAPLAL